MSSQIIAYRQSYVSKCFESNLLKKFSTTVVLLKIIYYLAKSIFQETIGYLLLILTSTMALKGLTWRVGSILMKNLTIIYFVPLYIPAKNIRKSESIRYFQGGIKRGKWHEMGYSRVLYCFYDFLQLNKRQICHHIETNIENNGNFIKKINWLVSLWWQL